MKNDGSLNDSLVLVADDDAHTLELVSLYLRKAGHSVETASDGTEALRKARELHPALAVLDIMMPGPDGLQICRKIAGEIPVLLLTARSSDLDKIAGLRLGADDYVTKPFNPEELVARVEAILRRSSSQPREAAPLRAAFGPLEVDTASREAVIGGCTLRLTPREFDLLATFVRLPNVVLDRDRLLDLAWGTTFYAFRTVDVHVARLREKLQGSGVRIETVWGSGYRLVMDGDG